jgi:hypothetical protein
MYVCMYTFNASMYIHALPSSQQEHPTTNDCIYIDTCTHTSIHTYTHKGSLSDCAHLLPSKNIPPLQYMHIHTYTYIHIHTHSIPRRLCTSSSQQEHPPATTHTKNLSRPHKPAPRALPPTFTHIIQPKSPHAEYSGLRLRPNEFWRGLFHEWSKIRG